MTGGGTTTIQVTGHGEVISAHASLVGTQNNWSGGRMPWGSWVSCEEAVSFDPREGVLYLTEDNFAFPSGFYRYKPTVNPMASGSIGNEGTLEMLKVVGVNNAHLEGFQVQGATYDVEWVPIADPDPVFPYTPDVAAPPRPAPSWSGSPRATAARW